MYLFTNTSVREGCDTRSVFMQSLTNWNSVFCFSPRSIGIPKQKNAVCPTIFPIAGGGIIGFISFPRVLALEEMQLLSKCNSRQNDRNNNNNAKSVIPIVVGELGKTLKGMIKIREQVEAIQTTALQRSIRILHPYSSIDTTAAWKKQRFILLVRSDFNMTDRLSIASCPCLC